MKRRVSRSKIKSKSFSARARLYLSAVLALPFIIGGVLLVQAEWLDPEGSVPTGLPNDYNLPGVVFRYPGATIEQAGNIHISGSIKAGSDITIPAAAKITTGKLEATTTLGNAITAITTDTNIASAAISAVGTFQGNNRKAWAAYFGAAGTNPDGSIFAKEYCSPGAAVDDPPVCTGSFGSGSSGDLWEKIPSDGNNIRQKSPRGTVAIGADIIQATLDNGIKDNLQLFLGSQNNKAPRVYLAYDPNDATTNPEIDFQLSTTANDHWGIFADKATRNLNFWQGSNLLSVSPSGRINIAGDSPVLVFQGFTPMSVQLSANPSSGGLPLTTTLTVVVTGSSGASLVYNFYCEDGGAISSTQTTTSTTASTSCTYVTGGVKVAKVEVKKGNEITYSTVNISIDLGVILTATPSSGTETLSVSLKADVSGTATGIVNYKFYCDKNDPSPKQSVNVNANTWTMAGSCSYSFVSAHEPKVVVTRAGLTASDTKNITVNQAPLKVDSFIANPASTTGTSITSQFTVNISGTANGNIRYRLDCGNNGSYEQDVTNTSNPYTFTTTCSYSSNSQNTFTTRVVVDRQGNSASATAGVIVKDVGGGG